MKTNILARLSFVMAVVGLLLSAGSAISRSTDALLIRTLVIGQGLILLTVLAVVLIVTQSDAISED